MDSLAERFDGDDDAEIEVALVVVMMVSDDGEETHLHYRCSDDRPWIQRGLIHETLEVAQRASRSNDDEPGDDDGEGEL